MQACVDCMHSTKRSIETIFLPLSKCGETLQVIFLRQGLAKCWLFEGEIAEACIFCSILQHISLYSIRIINSKRIKEVSRSTNDHTSAIIIVMRRDPQPHLFGHRWIEKIS